jgi:Domain of unknown function (DUF4173)
MQRRIIEELLIIVAILAFNVLFWSEKMGLNVLLYTLVVTAALWYRYPESRQERMVQILSAGTLLAAIWVITANSMMSKWMWVLSLTAMAGSWQFNFLRFLWYSMAVVWMNVFWVPVLAYQNWAALRQKEATTTPKRKRRIGFGIGPLFISLVFIVLYSIANEHFGQLMLDIWDGFFRLFSLDISFERVVFFLFGFMLTGALLWRNREHFVAKIDPRYTFDLMRNHHKRPKVVPKWLNFPTLALRHKLDRAVFALGALNIITLLANVLDIQYVWLDSLERSAIEMKMYVHEGTYVLIFSIVLAMGVLFFYFYKNLNFIHANERLKILAYAWIAQNVFLALSVGRRNFDYINGEALGYKRIGVFIFLTCVLFGLYTMVQKIRDRKTIFFVLTRNAWFVYGLILVLSSVHWDIFVTRFNLDFQQQNPKHQLDTHFLMQEVSNKNLWLMEQRKSEWMTTDYFSSEHKRRILEFTGEQQRLSWLSWNYPDWLNRDFLKQ